MDAAYGFFLIICIECDKKWDVLANNILNMMLIRFKWEINYIPNKYTIFTLTLLVHFLYFLIELSVCLGGMFIFKRVF